MKWILRAVSLALVVGLCLMIFGFSAENADTSGNTSEKVVRAAALVLTGQDIFSETCTLSDSFIETATFIVRKLAHFTEFFLLCFSASAFIHTFSLAPWVKATVPLLFALAMACSDEIHQLFVPGRSGSVRDVCIDFAGALLAQAFILLALRFYRKRKKIIFESNKNCSASG